MVSKFLLDMPKVELHAHLNGSLSTASILELGAAVYGEQSPEFVQLAKEFNGANGFEEIFSKFKFMHSLTETPKGLYLATQLAIREFVQDNVMYVELRTTPKDTKEMGVALYLQTVLQAIEESAKQYKDITVYLLPSIDRTQSIHTKTTGLWDLINGEWLLSQYNDLIPGVDFSGHPEKGRFKDFLPFLENARDIELKLAMHCAEVNNPSEINEMLEFGMDRCGHGTFLSEAQLLHLASKNVGIECCLTSNVKSKTVERYGDHHFDKIYTHPHTRHIPVLCTDDSGVFDTTLSKEFALAVYNFDLSQEDVLAISRNAVEQSFASTEVKDEMRAKLDSYFEKHT